MRVEHLDGASVARKRIVHERTELAGPVESQRAFLELAAERRGGKTCRRIRRSGDDPPHDRAAAQHLLTGGVRAFPLLVYAREQRLRKRAVFGQLATLRDKRAFPHPQKPVAFLRFGKQRREPCGIRLKRGIRRPGATDRSYRREQCASGNCCLDCFHFLFSLFHQILQLTSCAMKPHPGSSLFISMGRS